MNAKELAKRGGMLSEDEVDAIQKVVGMIHDVDRPVIVNIGAGLGTSTLAILEASPRAFIFEIDRKLRPEAIKNIQEAGFSGQNRVVRIIGNSWDIGENWPYQADMIFVDGAHYDEAVIADIEAWFPKLKPFGYILFHDYNHPNVPSLTAIVNQRMGHLDIVCEARYLIGFQKGG